MITSDRTFGVEIEFISKCEKDFYNIARRINVVHDGSLRPHKYAGEYVSAVLRGKSGQNELIHTCDLLKKYEANVEDPATSVHIHLDGGKKKRGIVKTRKPQGTKKPQVALSRKLGRDVSEGKIFDMLSGNSFFDIRGAYTSSFGDITYFSKAELTNQPKINYEYYTLSEDTRYEWLQRVFYFYTQYSKQISNMVSKSRKEGNMYCVPIGSSYELKDIENAKSLDDIASVWYKTDPRTGKYNNSRYHDINLHCFFTKLGTIEIRLHGGTIDPYKILLWIKLHQHILDKLENMTLEEVKAGKDLDKSFIKFIDDDMLVEYIKRMWGYFSNVTVK